jgi:hypothetical protein
MRAALKLSDDKGMELLGAMALVRPRVLRCGVPEIRAIIDFNHKQTGPACILRRNLAPTNIIENP